MFGYVAQSATASFFVEITADAWAIATWEEDDLRVEGGRSVPGQWPHGIIALARYADLLATHQVHPAGGDSIRGVVRRAAATVPHACGVDWLPEDMRLVYTLAFVANAREAS